MLRFAQLTPSSKLKVSMSSQMRKQYTHELVSMVKFVRQHLPSGKNIQAWNCHKKLNS